MAEKAKKSDKVEDPRILELIERINKVREYHNLSGMALAAKIDMNYTTINNYLNGTKTPSAGFLVALKSTFMDVSMDWLISGEGKMLIEKPTRDELMKELADTKVNLLVQKGITDRICKILEDKIGGKGALPSAKEAI